MMARSMLVLVCAAMIAGFAACTSPVDLDTPRNRVAVGPPHVPLPEAARLRPRSVSVYVTESDDTAWVVGENTLAVTLDTTFNPPYHWITGKVSANLAKMSRAPVALSLFFACDTLVAGASGALTGNQFRIFAQRKIQNVMHYDTLSADSLGAHLAAAYSSTSFQIVDTFHFSIPSGRGVDPAITGEAVIRIAY